MFPSIAGFLLSQAISLRTMGYPQKVGTSDGISASQRCRYRGCRCKTHRLGLAIRSRSPAPRAHALPDGRHRTARPRIGTAPTGKDWATLNSTAARGCACFATPTHAESQATGSCLPAYRPAGRSCPWGWFERSPQACTFTQRPWTPPAPAPGGTGWFGHRPGAGAGRRTGGAGR